MRRQQPGAPRRDPVRLAPPHAATPPLRRMPPGTPFTKTSANVLDISRAQIAIQALPGENPTHQALANASAEPVAQPLQPSKTRNPHRPSPQPRGFVHGRFPYAGPVPGRATGDGRRPKTCTKDVPKSTNGFRQSSVTRLVPLPADDSGRKPGPRWAIANVIQLQKPAPIERRLASPAMPPGDRPETQP